MLTVLYEDNHLLAINKQAGELVQGDETGDVPLVERCKHYLKKKYHKPGDVFLGVVHRLDRPVSGVVIFARTTKALERMNTLFRERETKKTYWAIVRHKPAKECGTLIHWIIKNEKTNKVTAYTKENKEGQRSELSYQLLKEKDGFFLLEINPVTGRPHQIRVQLASLGCPIVGDLKYGYPQPNQDKSICLHARQLQFVHPVKKEKILIEALLPTNEYWKLFS
ncbi:MAG: RNA pseudouridylate synthase, group 1 [Cytophagales bacterium]|jgi:23S rRNA pseudouridine1911/1915/1917 synthase|nr:RluA family pseudouridine synthase [Bacteroidota bacterium]MBS1980835.1 RluA family pseudouridine synthase [Bacteroidota bacterium]WHZ08181.1 MAG: RNA pseudouridylate synthase, group 1 [Cytophagales bacterium]